MQTRESAAEAYRRWIDDTGGRLRAGDTAPATAEDAIRRARDIRKAMREAERDTFDANRRTPLDAQVLGSLDRDGYKVERLIFQTRPGCYATANTYVPAGKGPFPAVLCVHGHWAGARRDPVVQSRCIGLAKLGFFVLTLDAWGAGERGTRAGQNEYHGGLLGASLWPVGTPLHGLQLWDNVRALDYLQGRPEVDGKRIGCTGASGGGNQTTYLSAFDERIACAVPICSVGTFQDYLHAACCVDEVLLGGLTFAEEGDLLGLVAPRALMVVTATRDVYHFGPKSSAAALERARPYFQAHDAQERVKHVLFESGHDYSRPMREAMYGWMARWLKGEGDGSPIPEPEFKTEDMEAIRCFEPSARPEKVKTTVAFVRERAAELAKPKRMPLTETTWREQQRNTVRRLSTLLRLPDGAPLVHRESAGAAAPAGITSQVIETEPGVLVPIWHRAASGAANLAVLLHPKGRAAALSTPLARGLGEKGWHVLAPELRGCGELTLPGQGLGDRIPDHTLVEWSLWIDRPLMGQWVHDASGLIRSASAVLGGAPGKTVVVGWREAGLAALLTAALDNQVSGAAAIETPATFVSDTPPHEVRMAFFQPDLMKLGDLPYLAALAAPRRVLVANPVRLDGMSVTAGEIEDLYRWPRDLYRTLKKPDRFTASAGVSDAALLDHVLVLA